MSITSEITRLQGAKSTLKTKLNAKNDNEHQITDETIDEYGDFVDTIVADDTLVQITGANTSSTYGGYAAYFIPSINVKVTQANCAYLFYNFRAVKKIKIEFTTTPNNISGMFADCRQLEEVTVNGQINLQGTNMSSLFSSCTVISTLPAIDTSFATNLSSMFSSCTDGLVTAPTLDTSSAVDMSGMFYNCWALTTVPVYDTSSLQTMRNAFYGCPLNGASLNNVLSMCANATNYTATKTLREIGLSSSKASTCTTLNNWSAAQAAGWTTGF